MFINQYPYLNYHDLNLDWLIKQTKTVMEQITALQEEFAKIKVLTEEQINAMINAAIADNNVEIYSALVTLRSELTNAYTAYCNTQINNLKVYLDNQDIYYDTLAKGYAENAITVSEQYTDDKVLDYTKMINPITGTYDDVRVVVEDVVEYFHTGNTLTAGEYDALDLTAQAYDNYQLSAYDYDFNGKNLLV